VLEFIFGSKRINVRSLVPVLNQNETEWRNLLDTHSILYDEERCP
jgi:hypothetical protein